MRAVTGSRLISAPLPYGCHRQWRDIVLSFAVFLGLLGSNIVFAQPPTTSTAFPASDLICGPNSIYLLLRMRGVDVSWEALRATLSSQSGPMSLQEVRDACHHFGLAVEVMHLSRADLVTCNLPIIALFPPVGTATVGHYVVITTIRDGTATFVDGTTAKTQNLPFEQFIEQWSTYAVVPSRQTLGSSMLRSIGGLACIIVGAVLACSYRKPRCHQSKRATLILVGSIILTTSQAMGFGGVVPETGGDAVSGTLNSSNSDFWRRAENDGLNCLYVRLRLLGYEQSYEQFRELAGKPSEYQSMLSLSSLSGAIGFPCRPARLTAEELDAATLPLLVHEEPEGIGSGRFSLLVARTSTSVTLIEGDSMSWNRMQRELFDRQWTGYALVTLTHSQWTTTARRVGIFVAATYLVVFRLGRRKTGASTMSA